MAGAARQAAPCISDISLPHSPDCPSARQLRRRQRRRAGGGAGARGAAAVARGAGPAGAVCPGAGRQLRPGFCAAPRCRLTAEPLLSAQPASLRPAAAGAHRARSWHARTPFSELSARPFHATPYHAASLHCKTVQRHRAGLPAGVWCCAHCAGLVWCCAHCAWGRCAWRARSAAATLSCRRRCCAPSWRSAWPTEMLDCLRLLFLCRRERER